MATTNDPRDDATLALDHRIWVEVMGSESPNDVMGYSLYAQPMAIAAAACILLAHTVPEPPILARYDLRTIADSLERTLRFQANARGDARDEAPN